MLNYIRNFIRNIWRTPPKLVPPEPLPNPEFKILKDNVNRTQANFENVLKSFEETMKQFETLVDNFNCPTITVKCCNCKTIKSISKNTTVPRCKCGGFYMPH